MGRYVNSTVTEFTMLPCSHEQNEFAEHPEGLEIVCLVDGKRTFIPRVCECGVVVAQARKPHQEGDKPPCWFPRLAQDLNPLRSIEESLRIAGLPVVVTAKEVLAGHMNVQHPQKIHPDRR